eukprot:TRINITY_DN4036_c1_g1_i1.p1 TRINITY_DN4036_c1_g1~~TRINITY_DN4036_c1_g1_i1.p1  ORF type:complete len:234 (+),score=80.94 TRINITY_DN4036_c1_g1_i1:66-704(+)
MCTCNENVKALGISSGILSSYVLLYSGYSKATKSLDMELVKEILFVKKGMKHSVNQMNKVLGLTALTVGGVALIPSEVTNNCQKGLLTIAAGFASVHAVLSSYIFYGFNPKKMILGQGKPQIPAEIPALIFGMAGIYGIITQSFNTSVRTPAAYAALFLSLLHFYFIETPTGLPQDLPCRPYAYTSVVASGSALYSFGFKNLVDYFASFLKF